jgi:hypothetical protein
MKLEFLEASVWEDLLGRPEVCDGFVSTELLLEDGKKGQIYLFASKDRSLHCAVSLGKIRPSKKKQRPVAGLEINEIELAIRNSSRSGFIDIRCSSQYKEIFTWFVREVGKFHLLKGHPPREAVANALATGRRFWQAPGESVMDLKLQLGLWGEILCLRELLGVLDTTSVSAWTGPIREDYDFVFTKTLVETKTTLRPRHVHEISNLKQLDPPTGLKLFVWSICANKDPEGTSVWEEAQLVLTELKERQEIQELFLDKVARAGLRPEHEKAYTENRFQKRSRCIYSVGEEFPHITANSFKVPLPREILGVSYTVDLQDVRPCLEAEFVKAIKHG